jgi:hypothetical protein
LSTSNFLKQTMLRASGSVASQALLSQAHNCKCGATAYSTPRDACFPSFRVLTANHSLWLIVHTRYEHHQNTQLPVLLPLPPPLRRVFPCQSLKLTQTDNPQIMRRSLELGPSSPITHHHSLTQNTSVLENWLNMLDLERFCESGWLHVCLYLSIL